MTKLFPIAMFCTVIIIPICAFSVPNYLTHQGRILETDLTPLSGVVNLEFTLYSQAEGGDLLWTETLNTSFDDGFYTVTLGTLTPISIELFTQSELYLGITTDSSEEFSPRQKISSAPYSFQAGSVQGAVNALGGLRIDGIFVIDETGQWVGPPVGMNEEELATYLSTNSYVTQSDLFSGSFNDLSNIPEDILDGDDGLSESDLENYLTENNYLTSTEIDQRVFSGSFNDLSNIPADILDGDDGVLGTGTPNMLAKFTAEDTLGDSVIIESEGNIGIGTEAPDAKLEVVGVMMASTFRGSSGNTVYGNVWREGTLNPGETGGQQNMNSLAGNGKVSFTICSMHSTNIHGGHVYKIFINAHGQAYNDYGPNLMEHLSNDGLSLTAGYSCVFTNNSQESAKYIIKQLPITSFATTMEGY